VRLRIKRLWQWLLAASGVVGSLFVIIDQTQQVTGWIGDASRSVIEWTVSTYYHFDSARHAAAAKAADAYQANEVCVGTVDAYDLDGDGYATDLIAKFVDVAFLAEIAPPMTCDDYMRDGLFDYSDRQRFLVAKGKGFEPEAIGSLTGFNGVEVVNGLVVGTYAQTDFPTTTIYGHQGGMLAKLQTFEHMLDYGSGDDEEIEVFDLIAHGNGVRVRAPSGLFDIQWSEESQSYSVVQANWTAAMADGVNVLYVTRMEGANEGAPTLMLNGERIAGLEEVGQTVARSVRALDRIVFDPMCPIHEGFKRIENTLGAVEPDATAQDHVFVCVLEADAQVKVRFDTY
jgi:hypothetical protein